MQRWVRLMWVSTVTHIYYCPASNWIVWEYSTMITELTVRNIRLCVGVFLL